MERGYSFHLHTALAEGLRELFERLENRLSLTHPLQVYLAGGMARANEAIGGYVGGVEMLRANLRSAVSCARAAEPESRQHED
jgi:hypothetical protein